MNKFIGEWLKQDTDNICYKQKTSTNNYSDKRIIIQATYDYNEN